MLQNVNRKNQYICSVLWHLDILLIIFMTFRVIRRENEKQNKHIFWKLKSSVVIKFQGNSFFHLEPSLLQQSYEYISYQNHYYTTTSCSANSTHSFVRHIRSSFNSSLFCLWIEQSSFIDRPLFLCSLKTQVRTFIAWRLAYLQRITISKINSRDSPNIVLANAMKDTRQCYFELGSTTSNHNNISG